MDAITWVVLALSVLISFTGMVVLCSTIQRHTENKLDVNSSAYCR